jgi:hypothetical protein
MNPEIAHTYRSQLIIKLLQCPPDCVLAQITALLHTVVNCQSRPGRHSRMLCFYHTVDTISTAQDGDRVLALVPRSIR